MSTDNTTAGPLAGLKVLDFSTLLPGPYASQLLSDMGAQVLHIEAHNRIDLVRHLPPFVDTGLSAAAASLHRNKQSLGLNLKQPEALAIIHKLLDEYDVIIEQFRPGVMQKFGLDYLSLKQQYPQLIYCSISGFGQSGPYKHKAGHDINYLALSGLASYSGRPETGPVLSGTQVADIAGGSHHAVMAILAAVIERQHSKQGQAIDISMSDCALALNTLEGANYLAGADATRYGTGMLNGGCFYDYYACSDGEHLSIGGLEPQFIQGLIQVLGLEQHAALAQDPAPKAQQAFKQALADTIQQHPLAHWLAVFADTDLCVEPVLDLAQACDNEHFIARDMFTECALKTGQGEQSIKQINSPMQFSRFAKRKAKAGPRLGQDNQAILQALGYSEQNLDQLRQQGVIN